MENTDPEMVAWHLVEISGDRVVSVVLEGGIYIDGIKSSFYI